ncbi:MAG: NAD(P)H-dependent oxidoreductase [Caldilineaceae bacterium]
MRGLILDGGLGGAVATEAARQAVTELLEARGWTVDAIGLAEQKLAYCLGCFECWTKTPGICRIDDDGREVTAAMLASDMVMYLSPVTFGGYSSALKKALDRSICLVSPFFTRIDGEVHHQARYAHYPSVLGIGVLAAPDQVQEEIFGRLIVRNAINLHAPTCAGCIVYAGQSIATMTEALAAAVAALAAPVVEKTDKKAGKGAGVGTGAPANGQIQTQIQPGAQSRAYEGSR